MKSDIQLKDIVLSLVLLTRLPVPNLPDKWLQRQTQSVWSFPFVGAITGGVAVLSILIMQQLGQPHMICAGISLLISAGITGAMHEDGLSDTVDGFWGGYSRDRRLEIMRDSHIGTYGVLALILSVGLRWVAITALLDSVGPWVLIPVAALSRAAMPVLMVSLPNARDDGLAHRVGTPGRRATAYGLALATLMACGLLGIQAALWCLIVSALGLCGLHYLARAKISGRTGDVLGAAQQLCEILCLLTLLSLS